MLGDPGGFSQVDQERSQIGRHMLPMLVFYGALLVGVALVTFVLVTALLGYRALGTLAAAGAGLGALALSGAPPALLLFGVGANVLLLLTHRENLIRIRRGHEARGFFPPR